jgi:hypothetical protein
MDTVGFVSLHGLHAHAERCGDLSVAVAPRDQSQHLRFARSQGGIRADGTSHGQSRIALVVVGELLKRGTQDLGMMAGLFAPLSEREIRCPAENASGVIEECQQIAEYDGKGSSTQHC